MASPAADRAAPGSRVAPRSPRPASPGASLSFFASDAVAVSIPHHPPTVNGRRGSAAGRGGGRPRWPARRTPRSPRGRRSGRPPRRASTAIRAIRGAMTTTPSQSGNRRGASPTGARTRGAGGVDGGRRTRRAPIARRRARRLSTGGVIDTISPESDSRGTAPATVRADTAVVHHEEELQPGRPGTPRPPSPILASARARPSGSRVRSTARRIGEVAARPPGEASTRVRSGTG